MSRYQVVDADGSIRGFGQTFKTTDDALEGIDFRVNYDLDSPCEFPFSIVDRSTGRAVLLINLPE